jgi:hypothetical protein
MKRVLCILALVLPLPFLWAQEGTGFEYDKITTESRFAYSWGLRYSSEFTDMDVEIRNANNGSYTNEFRTMTSDGFNLFFQAAWKYLTLDIAPGYYIASGLDHGGNDIGVSIQPALVLPLTELLSPNAKFQVSFFFGPEFILRDRFGIYGAGGIDLGFAATEHHIVFLRASAGFGESGGARRDDIDPGSGQVTNVWPYMAWKFQAALGVKTRVLEDVFYLDNKETGHRRRR